MYVAMTRTKNKTFLVTPQYGESEFIRELRVDSEIKNFEFENFVVNNPSCPHCKTGRLIIRKNDSSGIEFVGCTHDPACNYTCNQVSIISNPKRCPSCGGYMVARQGTYGFFYGCTNYPKCTQTEKKNYEV
ncbi:MAG: topoisomerase DNA-binding C4 zinc finger domain-containing protein [Clostridiales bacterium]|nr:topoisomerase DNA-binding C4 zinc finger domain-containing protein [Clostridiales bacterium]